MDSFAAIYANPPDPNDEVPVYNKTATIYGATLPFHILTWLAVSFRLYTRYRVVRAPGWDDYFITISGVFNLASLIAFYGCFHFGLGKHLYYVDPNQRLPDSHNAEYEMGRKYSIKSSGGGSQENLTELQEHPKTDYSDPFVVDHVTGKLENNAEVVSQKQKKRRQK